MYSWELSYASATGSQFFGRFMPKIIKHEIMINAATTAHAMPSVWVCLGVNKGGLAGAKGGNGHAKPATLVGHK